MRKIFFIPLFATLFIAACKKEAIETKAPAALDVNKVTTNAPSPCTGNTWTFDQAYPGSSIIINYEPPLVYNNKVYVFDQGNQNDLTDGEIRIFDGVGWNTLPSQIPFAWGYNFSFTIGSKGYLGNTTKCGGAPLCSHYFYEYDFISNTWSEKTPSPGPDRNSVNYFSIGNKGYIAGGVSNDGGSARKDTWEYNPANDSWTQKADLPASAPLGLGGATGFSIGNKGYIVNGRVNWVPNDFYYNILLEYDPVANAWQNKASFPGVAREHSSVFVIAGVAYAGGGFSLTNQYLNDFYKYNPVSNSWSQVADTPPLVLRSLTPYTTGYGFSINSKGYVTYLIPNLLPYTPGMIKYKQKTCITVTPQ
jgi:Galactose oxidase, central domain